jgi:hypothetical protein
LPTGRTIFEKYGGRLPDLTGSELSNPLAVNYLVVTSDGAVAVAKRAVLAADVAKTSDDQLPLVVTVSGTCQPTKCCGPDGAFDLATAVAVEYEEEVFRGHRLTEDQIHHLGVARTTGFVYPFAYGFVTCGKDRTELTRADRTTEDGITEIAGYEFFENSVDGIVHKLQELNNWRNTDGSRRKIEDSLVFCLYKYAHLLNLRNPVYAPEELDRKMNPPRE